MSATEQQRFSTTKAEAIDVWDGPLLHRFGRYQHISTWIVSAVAPTLSAG